MPRVCWSDKAEDSLLNVVRFIIEQNQSLQRGLDVVASVEQKCLSYSEFPAAGTSRPDLGPGLRCFPVDNLLIVYRPIRDGIAVILVAHGRQDVRTVVQEIFGDQSAI